MKKVLIISYAFPPVGGAGVQRTLKFVKYLKDFNWEPYVLTVKNPSVPLKDEYLAKEIQQQNIYRAFSFEPDYRYKKGAWKKLEESSNSKRSKLITKIKNIIRSLINLILLPDPQIAWIPAAVVKGLVIVRKKNVDAIFVSAPPFSSFLIALIISKITGKPFVADFRDEWVAFYTKAYDFHKRATGSRIVKRLEQLVIRNASMIITATNGITRNYQNTYPHESYSIHTITNGYDPDDFEFIEEQYPASEKTKMEILYTGTIFDITTARYFLNALDELLTEKPNLEQNIEVSFVGRIVEEEMPYFDDFGKNKVLRLEGYIPHDQCNRRMFQADVLLLLLSEMPGTERILTGKIFEYLATGNQILAVIPEGELAEMLRAQGYPRIVHPLAIEEIKKNIFALVNEYSEFRTLRKSVSSSQITQFSRRELTRQLAEILNGIITY